MKTICFYCADQNPERDKSRGITTYTTSILETLRAGGRVNLSAIASQSSAGVPAGLPRFVLPFRTDHVAGRLLADHLHPWLVPNMKVDLWHYPKGFLPLGAQVRQPKVGTIADTILQYYADKYPKERSAAAYTYWIAMLKNALRRFDLVLTISEFSRREIAEFAERYRISMPPVVVTYLGVEGPSELRDSAGKGAHVLHLASAQPHKGTRWLLEQWRDLQRDGVSLPPLQLVGPMDGATGLIAAGLKNVEIFPAMPRSETLQRMRRARALLLPSEIEGFGLPTVEAYLAGTPVAYVVGTAVEEVLGAGTLGGFEFDRDSFRRALEEVLEMDGAQVVQKGDQLYTRFSWEACAERTLAAYQTIVP